MNSDRENRFLEVLQSHKGLILKVCSMYAGSRDDLKDLFQDVVLNVWKSFDSFRGDSKYSTWLYRIALNTAILSHRKASRSIATNDFETGTFIITQPEQTIGAEDFAILHTAIRQLPEIDRAIILLYLEELPQEEIAQVTGLTPNNVRVRILRIKMKLKTILEKQGYRIE